MGFRYSLAFYVNKSVNDGFVNHTLSSLDNSSESLSIYWDVNNDDGYCDFWATFENINIPKGSTIVYADLTMYAAKTEDGNVGTQLKAATTGDNPTNYSEFDSLVGTESYINMSFNESATRQKYKFNIASIINEKINADDWTEGDNIIFFTENSSGDTANSGVDIDSFDYDPSMRLTIVFEYPEEILLTDLFKSSRIETFKYERLSLVNERYIHNDWITNKVKQGSGNIRIDFTRDIIGSLNFEMTEYSDMNYITDLIRPWYCLNYNNTDYEFPLGTYLIVKPDRGSDGKEVSVNIQAYDLLYALEQDKITASITYDKGETVTDLIADVLDSVGTWVKYNVPSSSAVLAEDMSYEIGKSKRFIINSLLNTINYEPLWCTGMGIFKSIPWSDAKKSIWTFEDNNESLYESGINQNLDYSQMYNKVIIVAQQLTQDTDPLVSTLTFEDEGLEDHPLSYTNIGRYITKKFDSEAVTQGYLDLRARRELLKMLEIEEAISYKHAFVAKLFNDGLPYAGDCFTFKNTLLDLDAVYKIESQSYQLKTGSLVNSIIRRIIDI